MTLVEALGLFGHFVLLSFLSVGGAITTVPEMHRYLVVEHHWMTDDRFSASIALAQAAPGPNLLFVAVLGWNVAGAIGVIATMLGILLPSSFLSLYVTRWGARNRQSRGVRSFTIGMTPLTIGLLLATGWVLAKPYLAVAAHRWGATGLIVVTVLVMTRTRWSPMWLVLLGAVAGVLGWV